MGLGIPGYLGTGLVAPVQTTAPGAFYWTLTGTVLHPTNATWRVAVNAGGSAANFARVGGRVANTITAVSNVGAGEDTLIELSIPANMLSVDNDSIMYRTGLTFAANANNKQVRLYIGNTGSLSLIYDSTAQAQNGGDMSIDVFAMRSAFDTLELRVVVSNNTGSLFVNTAQVDTLAVATSLANQVDIRITGEAVADGDIVNRFAALNWEAAAP